MLHVLGPLDRIHDEREGGCIFVMRCTMPRHMAKIGLTEHPGVRSPKNLQNRCRRFLVNSLGQLQVLKRRVQLSQMRKAAA